MRKFVNFTEIALAYRLEYNHLFRGFLGKNQQAVQIQSPHNSPPHLLNSKHQNGKNFISMLPAGLTVTTINPQAPPASYSAHIHTAEASDGDEDDMDVSELPLNLVSTSLDDEEES